MKDQPSKEEQVPTFEVRKTGETPRGFAVLSFKCPRCGQVNNHTGEKVKISGAHHRSSHCPCWGLAGYYIREI